MADPAIATGTMHPFLATGVLLLLRVPKGLTSKTVHPWQNVQVQC